MSALASPGPDNGTVFAGRLGTRWRVVDKIGTGGTAVVYAVEDGSGVEAAAKLLSGHRFPVTDAMRTRFAREIAHLSSIDHPDVVSAWLCSALAGTQAMHDLSSAGGRHRRPVSVTTPAGVARIDHYLFEGTQRQRNYAALYFKRRGDLPRLARAVAAGAVDETQAKSR